MPNLTTQMSSFPKLLHLLMSNYPELANESQLNYSFFFAIRTKPINGENDRTSYHIDELMCKLTDIQF